MPSFSFLCLVGIFRTVFLFCRNWEKKGNLLLSMIMIQRQQLQVLLIMNNRWTIYWIHFIFVKLLQLLPTTIFLCFYFIFYLFFSTIIKSWLRQNSVQRSPIPKFCIETVKPQRGYRIVFKLLILWRQSCY